MMPFLLFKAIYLLIVCGMAAWLWQMGKRATWLHAWFDRVRAARIRSSEMRDRVKSRNVASGGGKFADQSGSNAAGQTWSNSAFGRRMAGSGLPTDEALGKMALRAMAERMTHADPEVLASCIASITAFLDSEITLTELTARLMKARDQLDKTWENALTLEFDMPFEKANEFRSTVKSSRNLVNECIAWCVAQKNLKTEKAVDWEREYPADFSWI